MSTYNFQSDFLKLVFLSFYSIILNGTSHERKRKKEKELTNKLENIIIIIKKTPSDNC